MSNRSKTLKALWQNGAYRKRQLKALRSKKRCDAIAKAHIILWQDKKYRKSLLAKRKAIWQDEAYHKRMSLAQTKSWANPIRKEKHSLDMKKAWRTPEYRMKMLPVVKRRWGNQTKKNWGDPVAKKKMLQHLKTFSKLPEQRQANAERMKLKWADPIFRAKMIKTRKTSYTPERAARAVATRVRNNPNLTAWNKGLTKETDKRLMAVSRKLQGRVPDYDKMRAWYRGINGAIRMRSKWEVAYAQYLDRKGLQWKYEPKFFYIGKGDWNGETYVPDFYLLKSRYYVEVKGRLSPVNERKIAAFRQKFPCLKFRLLQAKELINKDVLDIHGGAILASRVPPKVRAAGA